MKNSCYKCGKNLPEDHESTVCDECFERTIEKE